MTVSRQCLSSCYHAYKYVKKKNFKRKNRHVHVTALVGALPFGARGLGKAWSVVRYESYGWAVKPSQKSWVWYSVFLYLFKFMSILFLDSANPSHLDEKEEKLETRTVSASAKGSGWAIVITCRTSSVCRSFIHKHLWTTSSLKPLGQFSSNLLWSLLLKGGWKFVQMVMVR